jgi:hypothetical protein
VTLNEYIEEEIDLFLRSLMTDAGWEHYRDPGPASQIRLPKNRRFHTTSTQTRRSAVSIAAVQRRN